PFIWAAEHDLRVGRYRHSAVYMSANRKCILRACCQVERTQLNICTVVIARSLANINRVVVIMNDRPAAASLKSACTIKDRSIGCSAYLRILLHVIDNRTSGIVGAVSRSRRRGEGKR